MEKEKTWGGSRPNSGRPQGSRTHAISVRISERAAELLACKCRNKSELIDWLIINHYTAEL